MCGDIVQESVACDPLGLQLYWRGARLLRVELFFCTQSLTQTGLSAQGARILEFLQGYLQGGKQAPPRIALAWEELTPFQARVLGKLQAAVFRGQWISYQGLAELCKCPYAARAVGQVMARNPWPLLVPCHRVLAKGSKLGGFSSTLEMKKFLLQLEGVAYRQ